MKKFLVVLTFAVVMLSCEVPHDAMGKINNVETRVMNDPRFELKNVVQKQVVDIQVIVYKKAKSALKSDHIFALSDLEVENNTEVSFGLSSSGPLKIIIK